MESEEVENGNAERDGTENGETETYETATGDNLKQETPDGEPTDERETTNNRTDATTDATTDSTTDGSADSSADGPINERENGEPETEPSSNLQERETRESEEETNGTDTQAPERVRKYDRFKKVDRARYDRVNDFVRKRTYVTAREWAIARLCADFRTETGVEMTLVGENLPELVPFMEETYTPQAVNQARASFEDKVRKSGATFLYGAMSGFFTTEELDEMMYEVTETARFLLEVEGAEVDLDHESDVQDRISEAMREIRRSSEELRNEEKNHKCPECGHEF